MLKTGGGHLIFFDTKLEPQEWGEIYNTTLKEKVLQQIIKNELSLQTQEMLKLAKSTDKVLEIGIGSGQTSLCLARLGCETYALDNEQKCLDLALEVAKELKINLNAVHHDALKPLPFKEKEFDIIFHAGLMEHFPKEERINMLKLWRPYCKKNDIYYPQWQFSCLSHRQSLNATKWNLGLRLRAFYIYTNR